MNEQKLYTLRVTTVGHQHQTEPLPKDEAELNYQNRIMVEVKSCFGIGSKHNWQIEMLDDSEAVVKEFLLESTQKEE